MSELSVVDWFVTLLGSGPGAALYAQPLSEGHSLPLDFGRPDPGLGGDPASHVKVELGAADELLAPMNGLLWKIPDLPWSDEQTARWPRLVEIGQRELSPENLVPGDLLLEVWASAFRRMEQVLAAQEIPPFDTAEHPPSRPAPRWFVVRGVPATAVNTAVEALVDAQFFGGNVPDLNQFQAGEVPVYVGAGDVLASLASGTALELRAFDKTGQVIDPVSVFESFARLAADLNFRDLARPNFTAAQQWSAPSGPRHVLVFTNHRGAPYQPWNDANDPDGGLPEPFFHIGDDTLPFTPGSRSVLVLEGATATTHADSDPLISLGGEHERIGLHPDGIMKRQIRLPLAQFSFARVQVNDLREWFPHRQWGPITPGGEDLTRYTEHNEVIPMTDGVDTSRRIYRALRATYRDETYADDLDIPAGEPFESEPTAQPQVLLANAWTSVDYYLTGRRSMLTTPRLQPGFTAPDDLVDHLHLVPVAFSFPAEPSSPGGGGEAHHPWWLMIPEGTLPPGAWVEVQQLEETYEFVGDDPRHPEMDRASDLFGTLAAPTGRVGAFVGPSGQVALPVTLAPSFTHRARLRVVTWDREPGDEGTEPPPTRGAGRGVAKVRTYPGGGDSDGFALPVPASGPVPPLFPNVLASVSELFLEVPGVPGEAVVVVPASTLETAAVIVVFNARTGEAVFRHEPGENATDLRIPVTNVARRDVLLVGFLPAGETDLTAATHVFQVGVSTALAQAGTVPVHPLELGGVLREAIGEGVDVRVLAWRDNSQAFPDQLRLSVGMVHLVNATGPGGQRGQAISDPTGREVLPVHHQKGAFIRTAFDGVVAFVGGMDTKIGRWDTPEHRSVQPERPHAPWHDVHCRIRGRAAWDVYRNFQQRWNVAQSLPEISTDTGLTPLPLTSPLDVENTALTFSAGTHAVQINRTIASRIDAYASFVDPEKGDLSARESYRRAIERARHFLYIEEQYLWDADLAKRIRAKLVAGDLKFVILVLPRFQSELPVADLVFYATRRRSLQRILFGKEKLTDPPGDIGGDLSSRVVVINPRNDAGEVTYVHCKTTLVDDLWMTIGSANMSRRSMTYDSEITAASIDTVIRRGARQSVRQFRVALMASHLGLLESERPLVEDPDQAFDFLRRALADEIPWLIDRRRCESHDLTHTHYGFQPSQEEQATAAGMAFALDSDGEQTQHGLRYIDVLAFLRSNDREGLAASGTLEITFDTGALGLPAADLRVTVEVQDVLLGPGSKYGAGPFPGNSQPRVPVLAVNRDYFISAKATTAAAPNVLVGQVTNLPVNPDPYVTTLTLALAQP